jgi:hypothetical protein
MDKTPVKRKQQKVLFHIYICVLSRTHSSEDKIISLRQTRTLKTIIWKEIIPLAQKLKLSLYNLSVQRSTIKTGVNITFSVNSFYL